MSIIDEALSANATIASNYHPGRGKPPAPRIAIVACADSRLTDIEQMLGLAHADVDMIRNFGTVIDDDSVRDAEANTREQIQMARSHPWISPDVPVRGFVYDVSTGRLSEVFP
jgi:carbonic anhydrase